MIKLIIDEIKNAFPSKMIVVVKGDLYPISQAAAGLRAITRKCLVVRFTHIEVQVDRIERDERGKECGWTRRGSAACDKISNRNEMCADAPREWRRNSAMIKIKLGVADSGFSSIDRCHRALPIRGALIDALDGTK